MTESVKKKKSSNRRRQTYILARVTEAEKLKFQERANAAGMSGGDYIRKKCLEQKPLKARKTRSYDEAALSRMLALLGNATSNLNQMAHALNLAKNDEDYNMRYAAKVVERHEKRLAAYQEEISEFRMILRQILLHQ